MLGDFFRFRKALNQSTLDKDLVLNLINKDYAVSPLRQVIFINHLDLIQTPFSKIDDILTWFHINITRNSFDSLACSVIRMVATNKLYRSEYHEFLNHGITNNQILRLVEILGIDVSDDLSYIIQRSLIKDYVDFTTINTSQKRRRELDVGDIFLNQGQCQQCNWVVRSKNRHDYARCKCGESSIDGGSWYIKTRGPITLHTVYYKDIDE